MTRIKVKSMPATMVAPDGSVAEMTLADGIGRRVTLVFNPEAFADLVSSTLQLVMNQRMQTAAAAGSFRVQAQRVVVAAASAPVGGGAVVLSLKLGNGLTGDFSLTLAEAEELNKQIAAGLVSGARQGEAPRH